MANLIKQTKTQQPAGKAPGIGLDDGPDSLSFGLTGPVAGKVRDTIISAYQAQGMSHADAVTKFNQLNPNF